MAKDHLHLVAKRWTCTIMVNGSPSETREVVAVNQTRAARACFGAWYHVDRRHCTVHEDGSLEYRHPKNKNHVIVRYLGECDILPGVHDVYRGGAE